MKHLMMDLETWGTVPGCMIRSIGACVFDKTQIGAKFYLNITDESCIQVGLFKDPDTAKWWTHPDRAPAQQAFLDNPIPLEAAVQAFHNFVLDEQPAYIWCHGACFDEPIWRVAAMKVLRPVPWRYNVRCTRTCYDDHNFDPRTVKRQGVYHNALDDSIHQAGCVQAAWACKPQEQSDTRGTDELPRRHARANRRPTRSERE